LNRIFYTIIIFISSYLALSGQTDEKERLVQLSGIITDKAFNPVAGVAVISKALHRGTLSERTGIYSITTLPGDTVYFRALGFKRYHTVIPIDYASRHCKVDIALEIDTITIEEISIMPWKSYNEFIREMAKEHPVDPIIQNMNDNIASIYIAVANQTNVQISPETGYKYAMEQNFSAMATKNQYPVNNLLNPFAWAKFIKGMKSGMLKNQKTTKLVNAKVRKKIKNPDKDE
jgi:hypothetical protein